MRKRGNVLLYSLAIVVVLCIVIVATIDKKEKTPDRTPGEGGDKVTGTNNVAGTDKVAETMPSLSTALTNTPSATVDVSSKVEETSLLFENGMTLETRIKPPEGYERTTAERGSLTSYIRNLPMKPDGAEVMLYDGTPKGNQSAHAAVFAFDVGERDLQQCADSIIRVYAEYMYQAGKEEKIAFHLTNGFLMEYAKWRQGYRIQVEGNTVKWIKKTEADTSYESFRKYLNSVFTYAGTLSLSAEAKEISLEEVQVGDMFIQGGSPGHCVLVVDMARNEAGEFCFLLAQGYMPAQEFHVIRNPRHAENPWYYASESNYPLETAQWTFQEGSLKRLEGFLLN